MEIEGVLGGAERCKTAMVGKWHMGHLPKHLPITQGFDSYYGIPYSNDMDRDPSVKGNWVTTGKSSPNCKSSG